MWLQRTKRSIIEITDRSKFVTFENLLFLFTSNLQSCQQGARLTRHTKAAMLTGLSSKSNTHNAQFHLILFPFIQYKQIELLIIFNWNPGQSIPSFIEDGKKISFIFLRITMKEDEKKLKILFTSSVNKGLFFCHKIVLSYVK